MVVNITIRFDSPVNAKDISPYINWLLFEMKDGSFCELSVLSCSPHIMDSRDSVKFVCQDISSPNDQDSKNFLDWLNQVQCAHMVRLEYLPTPVTPISIDAFSIKIADESVNTFSHDMFECADNAIHATPKQLESMNLCYSLREIEYD